MLPFTHDQFFQVFADYNLATWPAAIIAYPIALIALAFAWRKSPQAARVTPAILALMWGWVGVIYHGIYFSSINPLARVFAIAFLIEAVLFAWQAMRGRGLEFGPRSRVREVVGGAMIIYAMILYPLIGLAFDERYPAMPLFGSAPCPLLIFTFGLMVWASQARWWLWVVPILWSLVGGSAAILLTVRQDWALPLSAIAALLFLWRDHRRSRTSAIR